ncbi:MAG: DEAD/DEAH box helicase [Deltaproteobacteria bacterium]|nr:DEAD/DEAH box helicase [Deltaproteobacteria bacterium]
MRITVSNKTRLEDLPSELEAELTERLTFPNPKWIENDRMGRWNGDTPETLTCFEDVENGLIIPRGFTRQLIGLCRRHGFRFRLEDQRRALPEVDFEFQGQLRPFQQEAVRAVMGRDFGTLSSLPGSGKTVVGLYIIAQRRQPALIVTHTQELRQQWVDRIRSFLGIPVDEIGIIGGGEQRIGDRVTVATVQTLYKCADQVAPHIGFLIVDECHRAPSRTFTQAVTAFDSRFMLGLSATPYRRDRLSRLIYWYLGDLVHEVPRESLLQTGDILPIEVIPRETKFRTWRDASEEYSTVLSELTEDRERNALIVEDVAGEARNGEGISLVLSDRKAHCEALRGLLRAKGIEAELLTGGVSNGERQAIVDRLNEGKVKVLVATGQLIGEGFDSKGLTTLFLATPIKFNGRVLQYLGRVLRPAPGKKRAKIYDYVDRNVGVLMASAKSRQKIYRGLEYERCDFATF